MSETGVQAKTEPVYEITGGKPVEGELTVLGSKNFATKAMVAALLGDSPTTFQNAPPIGDVAITEQMLMSIGATVTTDGSTVVVDPTTVIRPDVQHPDSASNRIPILLVGPLLHKFERVSVPALSGCNIGRRPVDFHLRAIEAFGGVVEETDEGYAAMRRGPRLQAAHIRLEYPSVGATETCLFLSVLAQGRSVIANAAVEPEILELITMLRSMGAVIFTSPGREIRVEGVERLSGTFTRISGDRIEAASWASLACASNGRITVNGVTLEHLGNFLSHFRQVGGGYTRLESGAVEFFRESSTMRPAVIETDVYPGFSTDWQQPFAVVLTQCEGISIVHETVYEDRFGYLRALSKLGANSQLTSHCLGSLPCRYRDKGYDHSAILSGPTQLVARDTEIQIPDLRAGLAYIIAAAMAEGRSIVSNVALLERGYGDIVPRLSSLNLDIKRTTRPVPR